ncbi:MAG: Gfo/Idh/MocA family oxidoreductase [Bifidobacteriaceae bacterium]|jgi:predicted dehydrogenase|nr:Gfo/Idh/MocA family oxidoreductase [Bifidobacteriaceae bacterium]
MSATTTAINGPDTSPNTGQPAEPPAKFVLIGAGWRSPYYLNPARRFPERWRVTSVVARSAARARAVSERWGTPVARSLDEALNLERPDFAVVAVPWAATPECLRELTALGIPALSETPPAPDLPGLRDLWHDIGHQNLVQVAEQYHRYPGHQARLAVIASGRIGEVGRASVSSTHQYHAMSLIRRYLSVGFEAAEVTGFASAHPLIDPMDPAGWRPASAETPVTTTFARLRFESGGVGHYDFTDNQWWNRLRGDRVLVRGSRGEIREDEVTALLEPKTINTTALRRWQTGVEMNLEGFDLVHISLGEEIVYRNPWVGGRLADDEIAVAEIMAGMAGWVRGGCGPGGPYPLAEGCQDHALALAIDQSIAEGRTVRLETQPWAAGAK